MTERETQLQGLATEWRTMAYTWRDCALYALAVGATGEEPQYTYEKDGFDNDRYGADAEYCVDIASEESLISPFAETARMTMRSLSQEYAGGMTSTELNASSYLSLIAFARA